MPMSITIVLLVVILLLLAVIIAMMVTGWPGRQRAEIEKTVSVLRREMAEHRGDSIRLMQSIRTEVEDAVQEALDREMTFQRSITVPAGPGSKEGAAGNSKENGAVSANTEKPVRQMSLFQQQAESRQPVSSETPEETPEEPEPDAKETDAEPMEKVQAVLHDDIPDIEDIQDLEDVK